MSDHDIRKVAAEFWRMAGGTSTFPCDIEASLLWALPLVVVKLPRLRTASVHAWLSDHDLEPIIPAGERELRACLIAYRGRGLVFVDGSDPHDEQTMSLAHELAHFLLDYFLPRDQAVRAFGPSILAALDGDRQLTDAEKLSAVLQGLTLGVYTSLWLRGPTGIARDSRVIAHEDAADALALEILAPRREVVARTKTPLEQSRYGLVAQVLRTDFGLPVAAADTYARLLCATAKSPRSMKDWLGID